MKRLAFSALLAVSVFVVGFLATPAHSGERFLGRLLVIDGGTATNRTMCASNTGTGTAGCSTSTLPFVVPSSTKITIQTDEACLVGTDVAGCDAGTCLYTAAGEKFPTSTGPAVVLVGLAAPGDAGTSGVAVKYTGGWVAIAPVLGAQVCHARVFERSGTE